MPAVHRHGSGCGWARRRLATTVAAALVLALPTWSAVASAATAPTVQELSAGITAGAGPNSITRGPDGAMWFTEFHADRIGRIAPDGTVTELPSSGPGLAAGADPSGIVAGPDGNLYFSEYEPGGNGAIGELNPTTGALVAQYPTPTAGSEPDGIAVGADGGIWFAEQGGNQLGRLDVTAHAIVEFPIQAVTHLVFKPTDLVAGPGGKLWITLLGTGQVASLDTDADSGYAVAVYDLPSGAGSGPEGITVGPDGALWLAEDTAGQIARLDPAAAVAGTTQGVREYAAGGHPLSIALADGDLWATDNTDRELLDYDPAAGTSTVFGAAQGVTGDATADAEDSAGNLWFTEFDADKVGKVSFPSPQAPPAPSTVLTNLSPPTVSGTASYGHTLTCNPGTWTGNPVFTYTWSWVPTTRVTPFTLKAGRPVFGVKAASLRKNSYFAHQSSFTVKESWQVGLGSTLTVPDVPNGSTFTCHVLAKVATTSFTAVSAYVASQSAPPRLVLHRLLGSGKLEEFPPPSITKDLGAGGVNICRPGTWTGDPKFTFNWYLIPPRKTTKPGKAVRLHTGQDYIVPIQDETKDLECTVTAVNLAGFAKAATNNYVVPASPPRSTQQPVVHVTTQQPPSAGEIGPTGGEVVAEALTLTCGPGTWSRPDLSYSTEWYAQDAATGKFDLPIVGGLQLRVDMRPGQLQLKATVECAVTATTRHGASATAYSGPIGFWSGCSEYYEDVDSGIDYSDPVIIGVAAASGGVAGAIAAASDLTGGFLSDLGVSLEQSSTEVYTYGPNCEDYQKYYMGQGYTVKQQPGDGP